MERTSPVDSLPAVRTPTIVDDYEKYLTPLNLDERTICEDYFHLLRCIESGVICENTEDAKLDGLPFIRNGRSLNSAEIRRSFFEILHYHGDTQFDVFEVFGIHSVPCPNPNCGDFLAYMSHTPASVPVHSHVTYQEARQSYDGLFDQTEIDTDTFIREEVGVVLYDSKFEHLKVRASRIMETFLEAWCRHEGPQGDWDVILVNSISSEQGVSDHIDPFVVSLKDIVNDFDGDFTLENPADEIREKRIATQCSLVQSDAKHLRKVIQGIHQVMTLVTLITHQFFRIGESQKGDATAADVFGDKTDDMPIEWVDYALEDSSKTIQSGWTKTVDDSGRTSYKAKNAVLETYVRWLEIWKIFQRGLLDIQVQSIYSWFGPRHTNGEYDSMMRCFQIHIETLFWVCEEIVPFVNDDVCVLYLIQ